MICMITHMNISMDDMGDTNTNISMGDHVSLRITSFLSCALFISGTQQILDEGKQWGGGAERVYEQVWKSLVFLMQEWLTIQIFPT